MAPNSMSAEGQARPASLSRNQSKTDIKYFPGKGFREVVLNPNDKGPGLNWLHINFLIVLPIIALFGVFTTPLQGKTLLLAVVTYFLAGFGITGGTCLAFLSCFC